MDLKRKIWKCCVVLEEKQRQIMLEMLCCVGRKTKTNNGSGHRGSVVLCWFYFNFLGMCLVFVFMFNFLFRFNLMFLFFGIEIFEF